jgi:hypothetical protein
MFRTGQVSGVAAVDDNGKLSCCLSSRDLRGLKAGHFSVLLLSVPQFLKSRFMGHQEYQVSV